MAAPDDQVERDTADSHNGIAMPEPGDHHTLGGLLFIRIEQSFCS